MLENVSKNEKRLTVRSTGKEDTPELANAGGNESVSNVQPTPRDVLIALRDVVVSYFGEKSLKQRLGAGDPSIFQLEALTPVVIQHMIGELKQESDPMKLPKCGVMFTEEAEGGISRYHDQEDKDGRIQTTGICIIQAAYGHNEGVVNSLIPVDTFYVDQTQAIYPVIRPKTHRMKPADVIIMVGNKEKKRLTLVANDQAIATKPSLSKEAVLTLKAFADALEDHYLRPMDVEFVVNEQEQTIYVVQARPIVHKTGLAEPSYLASPETIPGTQKLSGSAIGVAGGSLRWCAAKDQIVVASTINEALNKYQDKNIVKDSSKIKCIIVGKMAPSTSHEATTFRSEGKPVIYLEGWNTVTQWLEQPSCKLLISPQQDLVINWNGDQKELKEILADEKIALKGWVSYPIPKVISLIEGFVPQTLGYNDAIKQLLPDTINKDMFMNDLAQIRGLSPEYFFATFSDSWKKLLQALKIGSVEDASTALAKFLYELNYSIRLASMGITLEPYQLLTISLLQEYALLLAQSIKNNLDIQPTDLKYTKRLLPICFLESLLYQPPLFDQVVDAYSATTVIEQKLLGEQKIMRELKKAKFQDTSSGGYDTRVLVQCLRMRELIMTEDLENNWKNFLINFYQTARGPSKIAFRNLIFKIGALNILPVWLHTSFANAYKKSKENSEAIAQELIKEYDSQQAFLAELQKKSKELSAFGIAAFADPKTFDITWDTFQESILKDFLSDEFAQSFKQAQPLGKLAAVSIMTKLVNDVFDLSIKALTGSQLYRTGDKQIQIEHFIQMIKQYYILLEVIIKLDGKIDLTQKQKKAIDVVLNKTHGSQDIHATTPLLSIAAWTIGSGTGDINLGRLHYKPTTLEDIFQIIHQSLLVVLGKISSGAGVKSIERPSLLQAVENDFIEAGALLISINLSQGFIELCYNLPVQYHSAQFVIRYDKKSQQVKVTVRFFGQARLRWESMESFIGLFNRRIFFVSNIKRSKDAISFELLIGNINIVPLFSMIRKACVNLSNGVSPQYQEFLESIESLVPESNFKQALKEKAIKDLNSKNEHLRNEATDIFTNLFQRGEAIYEAAGAAANGVLSNEKDVRSTALTFFKEIFESLQFSVQDAYDEYYPKVVAYAAEAATKGVLSNEHGIRSTALNLFEELFQMDAGFEKAAEAAARGLEVSGAAIRSTALDLFNALFKKSQAFNEAAEAAAKGMLSNEPGIRSTALDLFRALLEYEEAFDQAAEAAANGVLNKHANIRITALELFQTLKKEFPTETKIKIDDLLNLDINNNIDSETKAGLQSLAEEIS